jgi:hypothetical protein
VTKRRRRHEAVDQMLDLSDNAVFVEQILLRAELVTARLALAHWQRRVSELESELPPDNPLRRRASS